MAINRYFVKSVSVYVIYDRVTGLIVGDTINTSEVVARIMKPKGLHFDERVESEGLKIPLGSEQIFHDTVAGIRYATAIDKEIAAKKLR